MDKGYDIKQVCIFRELNNNEDINRAWRNIKENNKISAKWSVDLYEFKQHKPWFEECLRSLDQRKQDKMQWLEYPNQSSVGNINNIRRETIRHVRNKKNISKLKSMNLELTVR